MLARIGMAVALTFALIASAFAQTQWDNYGRKTRPPRINPLLPNGNALDRKQDGTPTAPSGSLGQSTVGQPMGDTVGNPYDRAYGGYGR